MCSVTHSVPLHSRWARYYINRQLTAGAVWNCKNLRRKLITRGFTLSTFTLIEPVVIMAGTTAINAVLEALCLTDASAWPLFKRQTLTPRDVQKQVVENTYKVLAVKYCSAGRDNWDPE
jgi:hypothetical protein